MVLKILANARGAGGTQKTAVKVKKNPYTIVLAVSIVTEARLSFIMVDKKHPNVRDAITLKVKANIVFARFRKVFILLLFFHLLPCISTGPKFFSLEN